MQGLQGLLAGRSPADFYGLSQPPPLKGGLESPGRHPPLIPTDNLGRPGPLGHHRFPGIADLPTRLPSTSVGQPLGLIPGPGCDELNSLLGEEVKGGGEAVPSVGDEGPLDIPGGLILFSFCRLDQ